MGQQHPLRIWWWLGTCYPVTSAVPACTGPCTLMANQLASVREFYAQCKSRAFAFRPRSISRCHTAGAGSGAAGGPAAFSGDGPDRTGLAATPMVCGTLGVRKRDQSANTGGQEPGVTRGFSPGRDIPPSFSRPCRGNIPDFVCGRQENTSLRPGLASFPVCCVQYTTGRPRQGSGAVNPVPLCFSMRVHRMTVSKAMRTGVVTAGIREMTFAQGGAV